MSDLLPTENEIRDWELRYDCYGAYPRTRDDLRRALASLGFLDLAQRDDWTRSFVMPLIEGALSRLVADQRTAMRAETLRRREQDKEMHRRMFQRMQEKSAQTPEPDAIVITKKANHQRDKYIYEQMTKGKTLADIKVKVNARQEWYPIETDQGISQAAKRYAESQGLQWPIH